jgi:hypothetical protein
MKPYVFSASFTDQLETGIKDYIAQGLTPTLAIVFSSVDHNLEETVKIFKNHDIEVFGGSSCAEIVNGQVTEKSIAVMLLDINRENYSLNFFEVDANSEYQAGQQAGEWALSLYRNPGILFLSTAGTQENGTLNSDLVANGMAKILGSGVPVFGGMTGNNFSPDGHTYVFSSTAISFRSIMVLAIDLDAIEMKGHMIGGWKGIGTIKTVTHSEGNIVYTIDHQPALAVIKKYFNITDSLDITRIWEFGFVLVREDGTTVLRTMNRVFEDQSLSCTGAIPLGSKIRFSMAPGFDVLQQTIRDLCEYQKQTPDAEAIILFDCVARLMAFGPSAENETMEIARLWKVPMTGFFTYGEFGPNEKGNCDFHNYTLSMALLKEK